MGPRRASSACLFRHPGSQKFFEADDQRHQPRYPGDSPFPSPGRLRAAANLPASPRSTLETLVPTAGHFAGLLCVP